MMKVLVTADHHFDHQKIIGLANRPFSSLEEMNEALIERWNAVVGPGDLVYHLGDFAWKFSLERLRELRSRLNGGIYVVRGNHDPSKTRFLEAGFDLVLPGPVRLGNSLLSHRPLLPIQFPASGGRIVNVHGHTHGNPVDRELPLGSDLAHYVCVSVECTDYAPVELSDLLTQAERGR